MSREIVATIEQANGDLGSARTMPSIVEGASLLPFSSLSPDEFEIVTFLLLFEEQPDDEVFYYGKTADGGRDIVVRKSDKKCVYYQCKHYSRTVGVGEVRTELCKLYVNVQSGVLPETPDHLSFVVSSDFSSPAQDLLDSQSKWIDVCETSLESYLGEKPSDKLLAFAKSWWPKFSRVNGHELSHRLLKNPGICQRFFSVQKVVTGDLSILDPKIESMERSLRLLTSRLNISPNQLPNQLSDLLVQMERDNPGLRVEANIAPGKPSEFRIRASGISDVPIGKLAFPQSDSGQVGLKKFRNFLELGVEVELLEGEFIYESSIRDPRTTPGGRTTSLKLTPRLPDTALPVAISVLEGDACKRLLDLSYLKVLRMGTKEIEFQIAKGQFGGVITATLQLPENEPKQLLISRDLASVPASSARRTLELFLAISEQSTLELSLLETEMPIFAFKMGPQLKEDASDLRIAIELCRRLEVLSRSLQLDLRYPNEVTSAFGETTDFAHLAVTKGLVVEVNDGVPFEISIPVNVFRSARDRWENNLDVDIEFQGAGPIVIGGHPLPLGPRNIIMQGLPPPTIIPSDSTVNGSEIKGEFVDLTVVPRRLINIFPKFLVKKTSADTSA